MLRRAATLILLATLLAGCSLVQEPQLRELGGPTDGYTPTASYLKVHVKRADGTTALLDFDRGDWYTAEIARRVDLRKLDHVTAQAMPRDILNEYVVRAVVAPEELDALRYDAMGASHEQRAQMDAEHEELLARWLRDAAQGAPAPPTAPHALPAGTLV